MMDYYSPLRYPGGKGKVSNYFKQIYKDNLLYDGIYCEPYAGGASVALSLLLNQYASKVIINDIDRSLYSFWHSVLHDTDTLCRRVHDTRVTIREWKLQREIQLRKDKAALIDLGFSTFFLNRTNRSGILNAGVIGGKDQQGTWKIDARFNKKDLIARIERIAYYRKNIELHNCDAMKLIKSVKSKLPKNTLIYFDPPYFVKGKDLYLNYYKMHDHESIANEIERVSKQKWIVTYDNVKPIRDLYENFRQRKFDLNYSAAAPSRGQEVMIFSNNLHISKTPIINKSNRR